MDLITRKKSPTETIDNNRFCIFSAHLSWVLFRLLFFKGLLTCFDLWPFPSLSKGFCECIHPSIFFYILAMIGMQYSFMQDDSIATHLSSMINDQQLTSNLKAANSSPPNAKVTEMPILSWINARKMEKYESCVRVFIKSSFSLIITYIFWKRRKLKNFISFSGPWNVEKHFWWFAHYTMGKLGNQMVLGWNEQERMEAAFGLINY